MKFFSRNSIPVMVIIIMLVTASFFSGFFVGSDGGKQIGINGQFSNVDILQPVEVDFTSLWKVWNLINKKFAPATTTSIVTNEDKLYGMIQGLAKSLDDPYTVFLPPEDTEIFEADISGSFEGVGMEIGIRDNVLSVISPLKGNPAEKAGIKTGDKILKIGNIAADGMTIDKAVKLIRGKEGTTVLLTISRDGEDEFLEIEIIRSKIQIPTIKTELRADGIFIIELYNFSAISPNLFREALREFLLSGADKLILDLRGNPGGFLEAAIDMASWFLPTGKIVATEDFGQNGKPRVHRSKGYNIFNKNLKMVVIVNQGSASASEILAGALQQHNIAKLVGKNTFGKGSVQELVKITSESSLKVTVAHWLTPNGKSISDGGILPDIEVEITKEDFEAKKDPQLEEAIKLLLQ